MKTFALIYSDGLPYLRQQNPLIDTPHLVSEQAYKEHEALYADSALLFFDEIKGRRNYNEAELLVQWQHIDNNVWIDVSEPNFIGTAPNQYRQIFKLKNLLLPFQERAYLWAVDCFGEEKANNAKERAFRFLEEAIELVQATGVSREEVYRQITWTYGRDAGDAKQEVGGVMVTLAVLCSVLDINVDLSAENEYKRILADKDNIIEKHKLKIENNITA